MISKAAALQLVLPGLAVGSMACASLGQDEQGTPPQDPPSEIVLNENDSTRRVLLDSETLAKSPEVLEVPVESVRNEHQTPVSVFVHLEWETESGDRRQTLLGNFSLFPPDQPGRFALRVSDGLEQFRQSADDPDQAQATLLFELKRIAPERPWTPVEVTIGSLRWAYPKPAAS